MNTHRHVSFALVALLAISVVASAGPPEARDDFGKGQLGLEPNPPNAEGPELDPPEADLGVILEVLFEDIDATTQPQFTIKDAANPLVINIDDVGGMTGRLVSDHGVFSFELPPLDDMDGFTADDIVPTKAERDFTVSMTLASIVIDRAGENPIEHPVPEDIIDASFNVWGFIEKLPAVAPYLDADAPIPTKELDPAAVTGPETASITAWRLPVAISTDVEQLVELVMIDPEDKLAIGALDEFVDPTDILTTDAATTATDIQTKLNDGVTALTLNAVLTSLKTAAEKFGTVDVENVAATLVTLGISVNEVDTVLGDHPLTSFDPATKELSIVDGGLGDIALLAGEADLAFDNDLVTSLKDTESTKQTVFYYVSADPDALIGRAGIDAELGNYDTLLERGQELLKRGIDVDYVVNPEDCKDIISPSHNSFCGVLEDTVTEQAASAIKQIREGSGTGVGGVPDPDSNILKMLAPPGIGGGVPGGKLKHLPSMNLDPGYVNPDIVPDAGLPDVGQFWTPELPNLDRFELPQVHKPGWKLPPKGIGPVPDVEAPSDVWPDAPELACAGSCIPSWDPNLYDAILEGFQSPAMPNLAALVPVDDAVGIVAMATDAAGNGAVFAPLEALQKIAPGLSSTMTWRWVGGDGSILSNRGITGVEVELSYTDPFGLSTQSTMGTTNPNGYFVSAVPSLGTFTISGSKEGWGDAGGTGTAPAPGSSGGQEYQMANENTNSAVAFWSNYSLYLLLGAVVIAVLLYVLNKKGLLKTRRRRK